MTTERATRAAERMERDAARAGEDREGEASLGEASARVADAVADVSAEAGTRLTEVADSAGEVLRDVDRQLRASSDQSIAVIGALTFGVAIGLLLGGSNRLLVAAALIPAALVAAIAAERLDRAAGRSAEPLH